MLTAPQHERLAVDERPDRAVGPQEEADPAEPAGGLRDEGAAVEELGADLAVPGAGEAVVEAMALQLGTRVAVAVDDEERALAVEEQWRALRGAQVRRVVEPQPRRVAQRIGDDDAVREVVRLDPGAAQLEEVLDRLADEVGRRRVGPRRRRSRPAAR